MTESIWLRESKKLTFVCAIGLAGLLAHTPAIAQITPDDTLGAERSRVTRNANVRGRNADRIDGGAARGANLFHSFSEFNVGEGQRVYFGNPAGIENILGRVTGNDVSDIMGTLGVDGGANLFLLNPNGIIFGANARLDVRGAFVASAADRFSFPDGSEFSAINPQAPPLLTVAVPLGLQYGTPRGDVANAGLLSVDPQQSLTLHGGTVSNTGTLTASGGAVQMLGDRIALLDGTRIDVSSETGGGTVLIGGDFQGGNNLPTADRTFVAAGAFINADALTNGNGGRVIVWADEVAAFYGNISARGGSIAGNGGFAEVSGRQHLAFQGTVNLSAPNGSFGTLLLDPENILITNNPTNPRDVQLPTILFATDPGITYEISSTALQQQPAAVILEASNDIRIAEGVSLNFVAANEPTSDSSIRFVADGDENGSGSFVMEQNQIISTNGRIIEILGASLILGEIDSSSGSTNGGSVNLSANNGDISLTSINSSSFAPNVNGTSGAGGAVTIYASGNITSGLIDTAGITSNVGGALNASVVRITSPNGSIDLNNPEPRSGSNIFGSLIAIDTLADVSVVGSLNARSDASENTGGVIIGEILVPSSVTVGAISTRNRRGGNGGRIDVTTSGTFTVNNGFSRTNGLINDPNPPAGDFLISLGSEAFDRGGNISINAGGNITLAAGIFSDSFNSGNGGNVVLRSSNGSITIQTSTIDSRAGTTASNPIAPGNGGRISFSAAGNITVNGDVLSGSNLVGNGGEIVFSSGGGSIDTTAGVIDSSSQGGNAGAITFDAAENILTGNISSGSVLGNGNDIRLNSRNGGIDTTVGILNTSSLLGSAGDIWFEAGGDIFSGVILSAGSSGGNISLTSDANLFISNADIASVSTVGAGGAIALAANNIRLTGARVGTATNGEQQAGDITVNATESIFLRDGIIGSFGRGGSGDIQFDAGDRIRILNTADDGVPDQPLFAAPPGAAIATTTLGGGDSGDISITANRLLIESEPNVEGYAGISTLALSGSSGNSGRLTINATEFVRIIGNQSGQFDPPPSIDIDDAGARLTPAERNAIVDSATEVAEQINSIRTGLTTATLGSGEAGDLTVNTRSLVMRNGAAMTSGNGVPGSVFDGTDSPGTGNGGDLVINASESVSLQGQTALATATFSNGEAGDLTVSSDRITLRNESILAADTLGSGRAGMMQITTDRLRILEGSRIGAATLGDGFGGTIAINTPDNPAESIGIEGASSTTARQIIRSGIFTDSLGDQNAGNVRIYTDRLDIQERGGVSALSIGAGEAGDIQLNVFDTLNLREGGEISVLGVGESRAAGSIAINADDIRMESQSRITGITQAATGGDIRLNVQNDLIMSNDGGDVETEITTSGVGDSDAGEIRIRAYSVRGVLSENSDVIARTDRGAGGLVDVNSETIVVGFRDYDGDRTSESDFDAFSEGGSGDVNNNNNNPEAPLPEAPDLPDVAQSCPSSFDVTVRQTGGSSLVNVGRGGLPPDPSEALESNQIQTPWVTLDEGETVPESVDDSTIDPTPTVISEAQRWERLSDGDVLLTAQVDDAPTASPCLFSILR